MSAGRSVMLVCPRATVAMGCQLALCERPVALVGGLRGCPEQGTDASPGDAFGAWCPNGFEDKAFAAGPAALCPLEEVLTNGDVILVFGVEVIEPLGEFVGVVKVFLDRSWHSDHPRNVWRAGIAWTTNSASWPATIPISRTWRLCRADERGEIVKTDDSDGVSEVPEADQAAAEDKERLVHLDATLEAGQETELVKPGDGALDRPANPPEARPVSVLRRVINGWLPRASS